MLTREVPCRHCRATGHGAGRVPCPYCGGHGFGVSEYTSLRKSGMLRVEDARGHGNRRLFAFFLCAIGVLIMVLGLIAREGSLETLGLAMGAVALILLFGGKAIAALTNFTRLRRGRVAICACLVALGLFAALSAV